MATRLSVRVGLGAVRIERLLAGARMKGISNLGTACFCLGDFSVSFLCFGVCGVCFPVFWLSVLVQSIAWKDSSLK